MSVFAMETGDSDSLVMHQGLSASKPCSELQPAKSVSSIDASSQRSCLPRARSSDKVDLTSISEPNSFLFSLHRTHSGHLLSSKGVPHSVRPPANLPLASDHILDFLSKITTLQRQVVFFLDYDGTLSPIVDNPDTAIIPPVIRKALSAVASRFTTAIVTGRSKQKVMDMIKLDHLIYAASHGFDIFSPDGRVSHRVACEYIPALKAAARDLRALVSRYPGVFVEDNFLSISLHFRHLNPSLKFELVTDVNNIATRHGLHRHDGKMVHELRPPNDWHKGKAVDYLLTVLGLNRPDVVPVYIGDDISDESAFLTVRQRGISVIVADDNSSRPTAADFRLRDPFEVGTFLMQFACHKDLVVS